MSSRKYGNLMGIDRTVGIKGVTGQPMASVQVPVGEGCCMVGLCEPPDAHNIPMSVWIAFSPLLPSTTVIQNRVRTMFWYRRPSPGTIVQTLRLVISTGIVLATRRGQICSQNIQYTSIKSDFTNHVVSRLQSHRGLLKTGK